MKENKRKCVKCGASPADDSETKLFRFPKPGSTNITRCEQWAKYCFPEKPWANIDFQTKLYSEHRMLCHRHFNETAFIDFSSKTLRRFASPEFEDVSLPALQSSSFGHTVAGPSQPLKDLTNLLNKLPTSNDPLIQPKESVEYLKCKQYMHKICLLKKQLKYSKQKDILNKLNSNNNVKKLSNKLSPEFALLLQAQLKNYKKCGKGRRWTEDEKYTALRLYKRSPTCYRLLRRMFSLPAPTTLKTLLNKCKLNVGINPRMFKIVGKFVKSLPNIDNYFILIFDEMAIRKNLQYNIKEDVIDGFQDHGVQGRSPQPACYALVFMLTSIRKNYKQPIAYYLSGSSVTADRLVVLIKEVLQQCFDHSINVAATVCDMDGVNRRALALLGATASNPFFTLNEKKVFALFDTPHLIKCFRNLFMKYDIECEINITSSEGVKGRGIAKWNHIARLYELDNSNPNFVYAPGLRQEHINPNNKQKMRVNLAVQVLSHTVASGLNAYIGHGNLPADAIATADVVAKIDKLFDTLNSDSKDLRRGKPFATNLTKSTPHLPFIIEMKAFFTTLKFLGSRNTPPSQEGWVWHLTAIEMLWQNLSQKQKGFNSLATRKLQQDPLENLFGCIRGNCGSNSNPTTVQFIAALKTTILTKLSNIGSSGSNCENDCNNAIMDNFKMFLKHDEANAQNEENTPTIVDLNNVQEIIEENNEVQACAYVCGFIIKNHKNNCERCKDMFTTNERLALHNFTSLREYNEKKETLQYANEIFVLCVENCATMINDFLEKNAYKKDLIKIITSNLKETIDFNYLNNCTEHKEENIRYILKSVFHICVNRFCVKKNRMFSQESSKMALCRKIQILQHK